MKKSEKRSVCFVPRVITCHIEEIKVPRPLLIFCQSDNLIQVDIFNAKQCRCRSVGFCQLIWIHTVCEDRPYMGSTGPWLRVKDVDDDDDDDRICRSYSI